MLRQQAAACPLAAENGGAPACAPVSKRSATNAPTQAVMDNSPQAGTPESGGFLNQLARALHGLSRLSQPMTPGRGRTAPEKLEDSR